MAAIWRRLHAVRLGVKLALILLAAVVLALGVVYAIVVPRLESRLVEAKLEELSVAQNAVVAGLALNAARGVDLTDRSTLQEGTELYAQEYGVRVAVLSVYDGALFTFADSRTRGEDVPDLRVDPFATRAAASGGVERGRIVRDGEPYGVVARGYSDAVLVVTDRIDAAARAVALIRKSLIIGGAIGLCAALLAGVIAQLRYTRRIRRLEQAAERIAGGDLARQVPHEGADELGQLAGAMERMRSQLEQLDRARKAFIANASHELKTPLFALGGFLELMDDGDVDEATVREFTEQMRDQVARLTRLTGDLLDLSRLDAGQLPLAVESVDLLECGRAVVDDFRGVAETTGHELGSLGEDGIARADEGWVRRIVAALVENAIRHTPPGTNVTVRAYARGGEACLDVEDDGGGIQQTEAERLFERFYRGSGGIAHGSGLGLAIARELAQRMGGTLEVTSDRRRTVFTLTLPRSGVTFPRENVTVASR